MSRPVRVRFAPSPTGPLHIGGVRTALFNYLFAKKNNGVFYLRIEDTDQNRFVPGAEQYIFEALEWLGIAPSETVGKNEKFGPYRQSERKDLYKQYADQLINSGWAYYAFDTEKALEKEREKYKQENKTFIYNWHNREILDTSLRIPIEEAKKRINSGSDYVIRFKTPFNETLKLYDLIRGEISFETKNLDDKVLFKSDGMPTYHLANIVDDHLMETSHVIRGEEWLPSMPLHCLLYKAFGWEAPKFAHLPLILKPIGNGKLSKRDGEKLGIPVFPLDWKGEDGISLGYREKGYFPEAVVNFLALLGWNDGTEQEIFSLKELSEKFDLNRVNKSGAKFDPEKTKWFNHQYFQNKSSQFLFASIYSYIRYENKKEYQIIRKFGKLLAERQGKKINNNYQTYHVLGKYIKSIIPHIKERASFVSDFWDLADYFFVAPTSYDEKAAKNWKEETPRLMQELISVLENISDFTSVNIETVVKDWMTQNEIGMGKVMQPFRLSLVGALKGPHLFDIVELIGKEETIKRLEKAIDSL